MTTSQIKAIIELAQAEEYELLCDNGVVLYHNSKYPIGYFKIDEEDFAVQFKPATLNSAITVTLENSNNSKIINRCTTIIVPTEHVQFVQIKTTQEETTPIIDTLMAKGAFTAEEGDMFKKSKELFGIRK